MGWIVAPNVVSALLIWLSPAGWVAGLACWLGILMLQALLLGLFGRDSVIEIALGTSLLSGLVFILLRAAPFFR